MLALLVLCSGPAMAGAPDGTLTLDQAIQMALDYSPNMEQKRQLFEKAKEAQSESFTYFLPTIKTSYGWTRVQNETVVPTPWGSLPMQARDTYAWTTGVTQPLFTGFRIYSTYRMAELGVDEAELDIDLAMLDVALEVKETYYQLLGSLKGLEVARQAVRQLESHLKVAKDFHEVGILPINDVLKVEVELANARQAEVEAENRVALLESKLNTLLGVSVDARVTLADQLTDRDVDVTYVQARERASVERPELKMLAIKARQADYAVMTAQSDYYPQLALGGDYTFQSDEANLDDSEWYDNSGWTVYAQVELNIWEWGRTGNKVNQARADKKQVEAALKDLRDQVGLQVKQMYLSLQDAKRNIVTARASITQAQENYRITMERYREQLTTNTELLDAQTLLTQAQNNYYTALSVYNIAVARLYRAMGAGLPVDRQAEPAAETAAQ